ncbi:DAN domain family member 5 [Oreochromis niloticus]|uniref:DAN domain family, member 5 n=1 Tax=Oreochromis niloticus TaxID=8128 RepID=I3KNT3_ORENI|nr:DAN domain family member 5-like [Oreochromis niloticus]XP_025763422.1 DAN domain family member 5-like [Oreochromis niloticus]
MALLIAFIFLSSWTAVAVTLPYSSYVKGSRVDFESSGSGPEEPVQGIVKVVQLDHHTLTQSGFFRRGLTPRRTPSHSTRLPFPAFLSRGRPGQAGANKAPVNPLHNLRPKNPTELELKKKQGLQMWQKIIDKGSKMSLPVNLKDMKQTCTAVPFTQHVTADGCETVTVHNKLCFGQCSSLFVPSEGEFAGLSPETGAFHRRAPCSRCAPSKAQTVTVPLRCGADVREKRVMVVEECKCETGREEKSTMAAGSRHV